MNQNAMQGFDPQFEDIVDYILKITYQIWEGKQVELCYDYYSDDCPVYTLAGNSVGAKTVTDNTRKTQAAFPDRTLDAANIIWGGDAQTGFHTSHLIDTKMTAMGDSEFGPASGKQGRAFVIAHCICKDNRIIEEWLVRDNYLLAQQFGANPEQLAKEFAQVPMSHHFKQWRESELQRLSDRANGFIYNATEVNAQELSFLKQVYEVWMAGSADAAHQLYSDDASLHGSATRELTGPNAIAGFFSDLHNTLSNLKVSLDYFCTNSYRDDADYAAVRWTVSGQHSGDVLFGDASDAEILILGESQYRIHNGKVSEEWLIFDQIGVLTQIERARQQANT